MHRQDLLSWIYTSQIVQFAGLHATAQLVPPTVGILPASVAQLCQPCIRPCQGCRSIDGEYMHAL
jgi:hypothetical protein